MRHKTFLINPEIIRQNGINVFKCIQKPGEFVITFGGSYHAGFNMGFNCAEAVNFATRNWIDIGISAKFCKCLRDSVQIGMEDFVQTLLEKKMIKKKECKAYLKAIQDNKAKIGALSCEQINRQIEANNSCREKATKNKPVQKTASSEFAGPKLKNGIVKSKGVRAIRNSKRDSTQAKEGKLKRVYRKRSKY